MEGAKERVEFIAFLAMCGCRFDVILMDLDGTISDPFLGITRSVAFALRHFGIVVDDLRVLAPFIGPPLRFSFREFYHLSEAEVVVAIAKYREYFSSKGIFENVLYEGMRDFLERAYACGKVLMVATSKPTVFAERILAYFGIHRFFSFVGGCGLDGSREMKAEVIRFVLEENGITDLSGVVMVGDRSYDIEGARCLGIASVGVLYGYGNMAELSNADFLAKDVKGLCQIFGV